MAVAVDDGSVIVRCSPLILELAAALIGGLDSTTCSISGIASGEFILVEYGRRLLERRALIWSVTPAWDAVELTLTRRKPAFHRSWSETLPI